METIDKIIDFFCINTESEIENDSKCFLVISLFVSIVVAIITILLLLHLS